MASGNDPSAKKGPANQAKLSNHAYLSIQSTVVTTGKVMGSALKYFHIP